MWSSCLQRRSHSRVIRVHPLGGKKEKAVWAEWMMLIQHWATLWKHLFCIRPLCVPAGIERPRSLAEHSDWMILLMLTTQSDGRAAEFSSVQHITSWIMTLCMESLTLRQENISYLFFWFFCLGVQSGGVNVYFWGSVPGCITFLVFFLFQPAFWICFSVSLMVRWLKWIMSVLWNIYLLFQWCWKSPQPRVSVDGLYEF